MTIVLVGLVIVIALVALWLWKRTGLLQSAERAARVQANNAEQRLKNMDPKGQLDLFIADAEKEIREGARVLAGARGHFNTANRNVDTLVNDVAALEKKARELAQAAQSEKDEGARDRLLQAARDLAHQLVSKKESLEHARRARDNAKGEVENATKMLKAANERLNTARQQAESLGVKLDLAKMSSTVRDSLGSLAVGAEGSALGAIPEAIERVQRAIDQETARAEIADALTPGAETARVLEEFEAGRRNAAADEILQSLLGEQASESASEATAAS